MFAKLSTPEELTTAKLELSGHIEISSGKGKRGLKTLQQAAKKEHALVYTEPPYYPRPVSEALGVAAMKQGQKKLEEVIVQLLFNLPFSTALFTTE